MKKSKVDENLCIGCGTCEVLCPEVFRLENGKAKIKEGADHTKNEGCIRQSIDSCPVQAIGWEEK